MDEHEKILKDHGRALGEHLKALFVPEAGIPRPVISLKSVMPVALPVSQETLRDFRTFVEDQKRTFNPATLVLHLQPYGDPYHRKTLFVRYPYAELAQGERMVRVDDPRPVILVKLPISDVPSEWRTLKPLELLVQAQAPHVRHGVALGVGPVLPLRVPREEIPGKATGI